MAGKDKWNIALLLVLYTLQGIPMGLSSSVPLLLTEKGVSFKRLAEFSLVSWPFSLKLLWAPIVDALYSKSMGRRKSWLVPVQLVTGVLMFVLGNHVDDWLNADTPEEVNVTYLAISFFGLYFLMATQDIAVDGWALTILSRENIGHASTCNSIGQSAGYVLAFMVFMALNSPQFCNYLRPEPLDVGMVSLGSFMQFWGVVFLITTFLVWFFKKEPHVAEDELGIKETYKQMWQVMRLKPMSQLLKAFLTARVATACVETLAPVKLIGKGFPKEHLAALSIIFAPISLVLPMVVARYTGGNRPLDLQLKAYIPRLLLGVGFSCFIWWLPADLHKEGFTSFHYAVLIGCSMIQLVLSTMMFVAMMAFFARISDSSIGGTYMTLLNTIANIGAQWPNSAVLLMMGYLDSDTIDGQLVLTAIGLVIGCLWFVLNERRFHYLMDLPLDDWKVNADKKK